MSYQNMLLSLKLWLCNLWCVTNSGQLSALLEAWGKIAQKVKVKLQSVLWDFQKSVKFLTLLVKKHWVNENGPELSLI